MLEQRGNGLPDSLFAARLKAITDLSWAGSLKKPCQWG